MKQSVVEPIVVTRAMKLKSLFLILLHLLLMFSIFPSLQFLALSFGVSKAAILNFFLLANIILMFGYSWAAKKWNLFWFPDVLRGRFLLMALLLIFLLTAYKAFIFFFFATDTFQTQNDAALQEIASIANPVLFLVLTVVTGPILEELIYRHLIIGNLFANKPVIGLVFSSLLFGFLHVPTDVPSILLYVGLGLFFGIFYLISKKDIRYPILLHILNNLPAVIFMLNGTFD